MIRHFTATGIVLDDDRVLLIEHAKLGWWLPPGGHIDSNEDPVQAVLREVREEVGLECAVIGENHFAHEAVTVLSLPFTILVEDVPENGTVHHHIDFIYPLRPLTGTVTAQEAEVTGWRWVPISELETLTTPPELPDLIRAVARSTAA